jgi:hypothetical protein
MCIPLYFGQNHMNNDCKHRYVDVRPQHLPLSPQYRLGCSMFSRKEVTLPTGGILRNTPQKHKRPVLFLICVLQVCYTCVLHVLVNLSLFRSIHIRSRLMTLTPYRSILTVQVDQNTIQPHGIDIINTPL